MRHRPAPLSPASILVVVALAVASALPLSASTAATGNGLGASTYRIDHVTDGDTVVLRNGQRVRLVQIDTPEVYFGTECYGPQAWATTKRLLPAGIRVHLFAEPATDRVDDYGRMLRYVVRVADGVNVNVALVAVGAAAPYFYDGRRGMYASRLEILVESARAKHLGLWVRAPIRRMTRTGPSRPDARSARSTSGPRRSMDASRRTNVHERVVWAERTSRIA